MPVDWSRYPKDWKQISQRIRFERAGGQCEWVDQATGARCEARHGLPHPITDSLVILTVAHLGASHPDGRPGDKHDKLDVREENLAAWCQLHHLNYDRADHLARAAETRRQRKIALGQTLLPLDSQDESSPNTSSV